MFPPFNDRTLKKKRYFPSIYVGEEKCFFIYECKSEDFQKHAQALSDLCSAVSSVGNSSSFVDLSLISDGFPLPNLIYKEKNNNSPHFLRVQSEGDFAELEKCYKEGTLYRRYLDLPYKYVFNTDTRQTVFGNKLLYVFKCSNEQLDITDTLSITSALRKTLIKYSGDNVDLRRFISGHGDDGGKMESDHPIYGIFADPDNKNSLYPVKAVFMLLPKNTMEKMIEDVDNLIADMMGQNKKTKLFFGNSGEVDIFDSCTKEDMPYFGKSSSWTCLSNTWASVTPVVSHRIFRGGFYKGDIEKSKQVIIEACLYAGLPAPIKIEFSENSVFHNVPDAFEFPKVKAGRDSKNNMLRTQTHVVIEFGEKIGGPVVIGQSKYFGYGLLRPITG
jgi:CRISPR-associated protein Csb2